MLAADDIDAPFEIQCQGSTKSGPKRKCLIRGGAIHIWSKKPSLQSEPTTENPHRAIDPSAFDRGAKINDVSGQLRRLASSELEGTDVVAALQTAFGAEIAALIARQNPNAGPESLRYIMDQLLDAVREGLREATYTAANLPVPEPYGERDLTEQEFRELTNRIMNAATQGNVPATESMTATAKALGTILCTIGQRPGIDVDRLIAFGQQAIGQYAKDAIALRQQDRQEGQ